MPNLEREDEVNAALEAFLNAFAANLVALR